METRKVDDAIAVLTGCAMLIAAMVLTALLCRLLTKAAPLFESAMFPTVSAQGASRTLVAVFAHGDDETAAAPVLARYAREGANVYLVIATARRVGRIRRSPAGPSSHECAPTR